MGFTPTETIWFNGKLVPWNDAKVHVLAHGLQYGTGVFEGMKSYPTADGPAIFRLDAHLERFYKSAELYDLTIPYSQETIAEASRVSVVACEPSSELRSRGTIRKNHRSTITSGTDRNRLT